MHDVRVRHDEPMRRPIQERPDDALLHEHGDDQETVGDGQGHQELVEVLVGLRLPEDEEGEEVAAESEGAHRAQCHADDPELGGEHHGLVFGDHLVAEEIGARGGQVEVQVEVGERCRTHGFT